MKIKDYSRKEAVKAYRKIARELDRLQVGACQVISKTDNDKCFDLIFFFRGVAKRIKNKYEGD